MSEREYGMVSLVGAGPGDPDLITLKGLRRLNEADVVIYDRLIPRGLLAHVPAGAERIFAGDKPRGQDRNQEHINDLMITRSQEGKKVVRLKGGDPFVFGRGGEEASAMAEAGIRLLTDRATAQGLADEATAQLSRFEPETCYRAYLDLLES